MMQDQRDWDRRPFGHEDPPAEYRLWPFIATVVSLAIMGVPVNLFLMFPLGMASDACAGDDTRYYLCTGSGQDLVVVLPWIGLAAAVSISFVGAIVAKQFHRSPFWGLPLAALAYFVPTGIAWAIATAPAP